MAVTHQQARALAAIRVLTHDGVAPSYEELRAELGLAAVSGVKRLIDGLVQRGLVSTIPRHARSVRITGDLDGLERRSTADLEALRQRINHILKGRAQ
jgi:repressor LexA